MPSLTERLLPILRRPVGAPDREIAATHLLDWVAGCVAAEHAGAGRSLLGLTDFASPGPCTTFLSAPLDAETAAFVNSALALALEMDSTSRTARAHPGPGVIGAALAVAQRERSSGRQLLDAIVRGYEAMIRLAEAGGPGHYRLFHSTSTWGSAGSAIAAADLLGLDDEATLAALANALSRTGGVWQCRPERTATKLAHVGESTSAGIRAAVLARAGMSGPRQILEGDLGLFAATCPDPDPDAVDREPSAAWRIETTSLKPWPGCRHAHPAVTAAIRVRDELGKRGVAPTELDALEVHTYPEAIAFADNPAPTNEPEAMFSIQHLVSRAVQSGTLTLDDVQPAAIDDEATRTLVGRVTVAVGDRERRRYPEHWGARLHVRWPAGELTVEVPDALGDPENPMDPSVALAKVTTLLAAAGTDAGTRDDLVTAVRAISAAPDLTELSTVLSRMPGCRR